MFLRIVTKGGKDMNVMIATIDMRTEINILEMNEYETMMICRGSERMIKMINTWAP